LSLYKNEQSACTFWFDLSRWRYSGEEDKHLGGWEGGACTPSTLTRLRTGVSRLPALAADSTASGTWNPLAPRARLEGVPSPIVSVRMHVPSSMSEDTALAAQSENQNHFLALMSGGSRRRDTQQHTQRRASGLCGLLDARACSRGATHMSVTCILHNFDMS
jgi:hypothetical protein